MKELSLRKYEIFTRTLESREAIYVDFPESLNTEIKQYLLTMGITKLYSHQAEMFEKAQDRENIVITTSTASGKTLSFLLPVIQEILSNPSARAFFIYPTKALASDQYRAIKPIIDFFGENRISAGVYDGDTPVNERSRIRSNANIILTNPEMMNSSFLPYHSGKGNNFIFTNLKYVVVDELHYYRGAFGSHLSNVFKRLKRICKYYHSTPQYFCSSATIANPVELAEKMFSDKFCIINNDGSPCPRKIYHFIQPPRIKGTPYKKSVVSIAADIIPELICNDHSLISFCKSRKAVEVLLKESKYHLSDSSNAHHSLSQLLEGYRGGYKPSERKEIENKMVNGRIKGLVSTNALELGIDIGKVDTTVLVGYPGTKASFWQQTGRAGRSGVECNNYLILDDKPFDQFIAIKPEWLFESQSENAVIDPDNFYIQLAHVRSAAAELPLKPDDRSFFPNLGEIAKVLKEHNELTISSGNFVWCGSTNPSQDYSMRNMNSERYQVINRNNSEVITELDELQAYREAHIDSIYMHNGQIYKITELNLETKIAYAEPVDCDYYTVSFLDVRIHIIKKQKEKILGRTVCCFGDVSINESVFGHKKIQYHTNDNIGFDQLDISLPKSYDTEAVWIEIPNNVISKFFSNIALDSKESGYSPIDSNGKKNYLDSLGFALLNSALMVTMTTNSEISVGELLDNGKYSLCIHDLFIGGMGYSEKAFELIDVIISNAMTMIKGCKCEHGCASCVGDYHIDKNIILWALQSIYDEISYSGEIYDVPEEISIFEEKPYKYEYIEISEWNRFVNDYKDSGEQFSQFVSYVIKVNEDSGTLTLFLSNQFYCDWMNDKDNKLIMTNCIRKYFNVPENFNIIFSVIPGCSEEYDNEEKLQKRYSDLTKQ